MRTTSARAIAIVVSGLMATALSCNSIKQQKTNAAVAQGVAEAALKIELPITRIHPDDSIAMQISLVNVSSHDLWVNGRMLLNREDDMPEVRDVWLILEGPDGKDVPLTCYKNAKFVSGSDYKLLKPGESVTRVEIINDCYSVRNIGGYRVVAFYQDGNPHPPPAPASAERLKKMLQSEAASFTVATEP